MAKQIFTKKQRHEKYKSALQIMKNSDTVFRFGLCRYLTNAGFREYNNHPYMDCYNEMDILAPEADLFRPIKSDNDVYWLPTDKEGMEVRKTILEFCIEMTR